MEIYDIYRERYDHHVHHNSLSRHNIHHQFQQDHPTSSNECTEVLDLSRRCDSVETRKTPSPYATGSSLGTDSPSTQCGSPTNSTILTSNSNKSLIMPTLPSYPIYYPPIKRETNSPVSNNNNNNNATSISRHNSGSPTQVDFMKSIDLVKPITLITEKLSKNHQISSSTKHFDRSINEAKSPTNDPVIDQLPLASSPAIPLIYPKILANDGKSTRPFKAYPRDPLVIAANFAATDVLYDGPRVERYTEYRKRVLEQIRSANGGQRTITNPKMRRANSRNSRISSRDEELKPSKVSALNKTRANSSESEDRCTESSDNDASSCTPTTTNSNNNNNNNNNNSTIPNQNGVVKDAAYYERRRKNNAAAKKSRDRRRIKEDEIAIRAAYLERQNIELLCQLDALKAQLASLTKSC